MEPVFNYMMQNVHMPVKVSTLSAIAGVSNSHFFPLFKRATGLSPIEFFIRLRMRRACDLLGNQDLRIKQIADLLGYNDCFYFSRVFKLVTGVAPRENSRRISESQTKDPASTQTSFGKEAGHSLLPLPLASDSFKQVDLRATTTLVAL